MENEKHKAMAEKEFPHEPGIGKAAEAWNKRVDERRADFIAGLSKNEGLMEALDRIGKICLKDCYEVDAMMKDFRSIYEIATEALTQYKEGIG